MSDVNTPVEHGPPNSLHQNPSSSSKYTTSRSLLTPYIDKAYLSHSTAQCTVDAYSLYLRIALWEVHKLKNFRAPSACHKDAGASLRFILTTEIARRLGNQNTTSQPQRVHGTRLHLLCFGSSSGRALIAKSSMKQDAALCVFAACSISLLSNNLNLVRQLSRSQTVSLPESYCFNTVVFLCLSNVLWYG